MKVAVVVERVSGTAATARQMATLLLVTDVNMVRGYGSVH
jgi:hypothetical protein